MTDQQNPLTTERLLEFVQEENGRMVLRESKNKKQILVAIDFSDAVKDLLGEDTHHIGEYMIQAAIKAVAHRQNDKWHALVFDEEPRFYS